MSPVPIRLPDLGADRVTASLWFVQPGEAVVEGDRLLEVVIPGATCDVHAPAAGRLATRDVQPGDPLATGAILGWLAGDPNDSPPDGG